MFESPERLTSDDLARLIEALPRLDGAVDDVERIDQIRALEQLKGAAAAAQARVTAQFAACQRAAQVAAGVPVREVGRGIAGQVGLPPEGSRRRGHGAMWAGRRCWWLSCRVPSPRGNAGRPRSGGR